MIRRACFLSAVLALAAIASPWTSGIGVAQEPPRDGDKADRAILEQDIYIPYEKLRQVFEQHGRGVFLPYEKFQELWKAARDKTQPGAEPKPPVGALITESENEATVEKDVVRVKAKVKIDVLTEGWHEIGLRLKDAAITSATLDGKPARIVVAPGQDYRLLVEKRGKQAETLELALEYARAIARTPGQNRVSFEAPQAPVSRWRVVIPQGGVKVRISPLIAATEVPSEKKPEGDATKPPEETVVLAFVGAAPEVRIEWTPKAEGATGLAATASVQAEQQMWIGEGVTRTRATLAYAISRAELSQLSIDVPADQKVVNVFDANIRKWSVETLEGRQRITAQLFEPAKTAQQVIVELEKLTGDKPRDTIEVPVVRAAGGQDSRDRRSRPDGGQVRQQGVLVVHVAEGLRAEAIKTSGLLQVDAKELPEALRRAAWAFVYRYASADYQLTLGVEKVEPRIVADSLVDASVEPERLSLDLTSLYTIENAGVFRLELDIPSGYEVRHVRGDAVAGATAAQVDSHHVEGEKKTRLVVNLSRKAIGRVGLSVRLQKDLRRPDLLAPTGKAVEIAAPIPVVAPGTVERATGRLVMRAPESLRVDPKTIAGLRAVSFREAFEGMSRQGEQNQAGLRPVLAFAFGQEPTDLSLSVERRKPRVTVRQLVVTRVEEGVVKHQATLFYNVQYSGVKSLRIDVPADVARLLRVTTPGIHEKAIEPAPADVAKDCVAWSLTGESEVLGDCKIELACEKKIDKLDVDKNVDLSVPYLKPRDVDLAWGQIALVKSETIDVEVKGDDPKSLRQIDPQRDLTTPVGGAARAFEFHDDWTLAVRATRYQLEELKRTSIERAVVRMVVTPADSIAVQAIYRMKSARQRLQLKLPDDATFDTQPLRINGCPVALEKGDDRYLVPLAVTNAEAPFLLELRYTLPGDGSRLALPEFPEEPAVVKAFLCVYLPETQTLLGTRGPWGEEFRWRCTPALRWRPVPVEDAGRLLAWAGEGTSAPQAPGGEFQTDGRLYVYSTLAPAKGEAGALEMTTMDRRALHGLVFSVTILLGIVLLPARFSLRVLAIGAALAALVLAGAFLPTFLMQILNGVLASAVFIVAVLWGATFIARIRGRYFAGPRTAAPTATPAEPSKPEGREGGADHV